MEKQFISVYCLNDEVVTAFFNDAATSNSSSCFYVDQLGKHEFITFEVDYSKIEDRIMISSLLDYIQDDVINMEV